MPWKRLKNLENSPEEPVAIADDSGNMSRLCTRKRTFTHKFAGAKKDRIVPSTVKMVFKCSTNSSTRAELVSSCN